MLKLHKITKSFPLVFEPILKDISLELKEGDFAVLIGSNGSGKTTLFKTISGEYLPDIGQILLDNCDITRLPTYKRAKLISSVSQDVTKGTIQEMSVLENMALSHMRDKKSSFKSYKKLLPLLKEEIISLKLGFEKYLDTPLAALSGGQRQLIATIMAMSSHPALLLLDEHCSALDPKTQETLMAYTNKSILEQNKTALMITHNIKDVLAYGNRLLMLHQGKIVADLDASQKQKLSLNDLLHMFQKEEGFYV